MSDEPMPPAYEQYVTSRTETLELFLPQQEYAAVYDLLVMRSGYDLVSAFMLPDGRAHLTVRRCLGAG